MKFTNKYVYSIFNLILLLSCLSFAQMVSEGTIQKLISGFKSGRSYNELVGNEKMKIPDDIGKMEESKISHFNNFSSLEPVWDKNIDPDKFYVSSGSVFTIYIWGKIEKTFMLGIDNEGRTIIPLVGELDLKGKTLTATKKMIRNKLQEGLKDSATILIVLQNIQPFKVYVIGKVVSPGAYVVNGAIRISDLIENTGGILKSGRFRGIEIRNELYKTQYYDLKTYQNSQNLANNPYLREGDVVIVQPQIDFVTIEGFIQFAGRYDYCVGDKASDILLASGGFSRGVDTNKIIINRFVNNSDSLITFEITHLQANEFPIEKDDRILVCGIPDYRIHRQVSVKGQVKYPGIYPIRKDKTKLVDVIAMAGGLTEDAFLKGSKIVRKHYSKVGDRELERLKAMPALSLTPMERSYLKTRLIEEDGIVSIDFKELLTKGSDLYNIILRDKDEITVSRKSLSIKVSGAVVSPGLISFKENADYKYYIHQAGGYNTRAKKLGIMIVKGGTEIMLKPQKIKKLEAGDAIWIPEKEYRDGVQILKDVLVIVGTLLGIAVSTLVISDKL